MIASCCRRSEQRRLTEWADLLDKPRTIDQYIATPSKSIEPAALFAGWKKLARTDRDGAIARFDDTRTSARLESSAKQAAMRWRSLCRSRGIVAPRH